MSLLVFMGVYAIGDPIDIFISGDADQIERERAIAALGLDKPVWEQYLLFVQTRCSAISASPSCSTSRRCS